MAPFVVLIVVAFSPYLMAWLVTMLSCLRDKVFLLGEYEEWMIDPNYRSAFYVGQWIGEKFGEPTDSLPL